MNDSNEQDLSRLVVETRVVSGPVTVESEIVGKPTNPVPDLLQDTDTEDILAENSFKAYEEYTKTLRTWLVAFGIGGPVFFISQPELSKLIAGSGQAKAIVYSFLFGLSLQIGIAILNKWTNWFTYSMSVRSPIRINKFDGLWIWFSNQFWIDILVDIATVGLFLFATYKVLTFVFV